jgi:hypothetical protein
VLSFVFGEARDTLVTKDEFLQRMRDNPNAVPLPLEATPPEWMAAAWQLDAVREANTYDMARTVSKEGELSYTDEFLGLLGRSLDVERQVELFLAIRNRSPHREREFRPRFEQMFPRSVPTLPPPLSRQEVIDMMGLDEKLARHLLDGEEYTED